MSHSQAFVKTENVWFSYHPGHWVIQDVSFNIPKGGLAMLMGSSGSGKTTLLKIVGGFLPSQKGKVFLFGQELVNGKAKSLRHEIGYIPQQLGLVRHLSVLENVLIGSLNRTKGLAPLLGFFPKHEVEEAKLLLRQLGIEHKAEEKVIRLSGGERQRVAIARTLMQKPSLVLADEFVSDLDLKTAREILNLIQKIGRRDQVTFLLSMHEWQLVKDLDGQVMIVKNGKIVSRCRGGELEKCDFEAILQ